MKSFGKGVCIAVPFLFGIAALFGLSDSEKKGVVTYADGQVRRSPKSTENWESAPVNTEVLSGDKVRTYQLSRAELDLAQMDIIRLAPRTTVEITKLYQETQERKIQTELKLEEGELWASVHEVEMNTEFDISAPVAAAAITGTILRMHVDPDSTTQLKVYKGEVHITNAPERTDLQPKSLIPHEVPGPREIPGPREVSLDEWIYIVKSMQQITIDGQGKVVSQGDFTAKDQEEQDPWIKWNQKRDKRRLEQLKKVLEQKKE